MTRPAPPTAIPLRHGLLAVLIPRSMGKAERAELLAALGVRRAAQDTRKPRQSATDTDTEPDLSSLTDEACALIEQMLAKQDVQ
jgi:hypothetical protein